jgi:hypothetical protein
MNRSWIMALSLAAVAGSAGAFSGVIATSNGDAPTAAAQSPASVSELAFVRAEPQAPTTRTATYQVGGAGTATLSIANGSLVITRAAPGSGWRISSTSIPGSHVELQFSDGARLVTFGANLIGNDVAVSVTNVPASPPVTAATVEAVAMPTTTDTPVAPILPATPSRTTAKSVAAALPADASDRGSDDGLGAKSDHESDSNDD